MWNYSGVRQKEATIYGNMDVLEGMRVRGLSQAEKGRHGMISLVCRIKTKTMLVVGGWGR